MSSFRCSRLLCEKTFDTETLRELKSKARNMRDVLMGILDENEPLFKYLSVILAGYKRGDD